MAGIRLKTPGSAHSAARRADRISWFGTERQRLGRVGKGFLDAAPTGLGHGDSTRDHRRAVGGVGAVVPFPEGAGPTADGHAHDGGGNRVAVPYGRAVA